MKQVDPHRYYYVRMRNTTPHTVERVCVGCPAPTSDDKEVSSDEVRIALLTGNIIEWECDNQDDWVLNKYGHVISPAEEEGGE